MLGQRTPFIRTTADRQHVAAEIARGAHVAGGPDTHHAAAETIGLQGPGALEPGRNHGVRDRVGVDEALRGPADPDHRGRGQC